MSTSNAIRWTPEQEAVFAHFSSPSSPHLVVRARAGTGKTTVILHAVSLATWAGRILLAAFNKRIAEELKTKCQDSRTDIKTLHGVGFGFLRPLGRLRVEGDRETKIAKALNVPYELVPPVAKLAVKVKEIAPFGTPEEVKDLAWRFDCLPDDESYYTDADVAKHALAVCKASQENDGTVSFADMLYLPLVLNLARPSYDLVVVDEAQDMSPSQIILARRCVKSTGRIVVVGDDRQGIYAFRGADSRTIDNLKAELSADELGLTVTHRCPRSVVAYAATLVPDYRAADSAPEGAISEATLSQLYTLAGPGSFVLSRKNAPLMSVCLGFLKRGIRAKIQGRDIGSQLTNLVRKLRAKSIPDFIARLQAWRDKEVKRAKARGNGVGQSREDTVHDIADTLLALAEDVGGLAELESKIASLFDEVTASLFDDSNNNGYVICSSVHKAKGLEAKSVFVLVDTLYPGGKKDSLEEQNIEYVAVTRTRELLTWVSGEEM